MSASLDFLCRLLVFERRSGNSSQGFLTREGNTGRLNCVMLWQLSGSGRGRGPRQRCLDENLTIVRYFEAIVAQSSGTEIRGMIR